MRSCRNPVFALALLVSSASFTAAALTACPSVAQADETQNRNLAAQLFKAGREDMAAEKWEPAAAKLQESHRLLPAMGTLLNLAVCQEHLGKTASAYQNFSEVIREAKTSGRTDRLELASAEVEKLLPLLADVTVHVAANVQALPGLAVTVDGAPLPPALFETKVDYDPGTHRIEAKADGKKPWTATFEVKPSSRGELTVPLLVDKPFDPNEVTVSLADAERDSKKRALRTAGWVLVGVGGASAVTSMVFGVLAIHAKGQVHNCNDEHCSAADSDQSKTANRDAVVANVTFGAGLGIAAVGAAFVFFARPSGPSAKPLEANPALQESAYRLAPTFDAHGGGMSLVGRW